MLILRGGRGGFFLGLATVTGGGAGGATEDCSSIRDWNWILILVLGNLRTHLKDKVILLLKKYKTQLLTSCSWL